MSGRESNNLDVSVGETELVGTLLGLNCLTYRSSMDSRMYQPVGGIPSLVDYLEKKYNKHIVITAGAKGAIHACFNMMNSLNKTQVNIVNPYWTVFNNTFKHYPFKVTNDFSKNDNSFNFIVSPNNPDGQIYNQEISNYTIHDAVYNLDYFTDNVKDFGNIQIYSASKQLGCSGYRMGFLCCDDLSTKEYLSEIVEEFSVGISSASQKLVLEAFKILDSFDTGIIKNQLFSNKQKVLNALSDYGEFKSSDSIFLYGKLEKPLPKEIIVATYPDNHIRINCCYSESKVNELVKALQG